MSARAAAVAAVPAPARFGVGFDPRQARLVAEALAPRPYREVHALIGRLDAWAAAPGAGEGAPFALSLDELRLVLDALADLPYRRVHALVGSLGRQLAATRAAAPEAP